MLVYDFNCKEHRWESCSNRSWPTGLISLARQMACCRKLAPNPVTCPRSTKFHTHVRKNASNRCIPQVGRLAERLRSLSGKYLVASQVQAPVLAIMNWGHYLKPNRRLRKVLTQASMTKPQVLDNRKPPPCSHSHIIESEFTHACRSSGNSGPFACLKFQ